MAMKTRYFAPACAALVVSLMAWVLLDTDAQVFVRIAWLGLLPVFALLLHGGRDMPLKSADRVDAANGDAREPKCQDAPEPKQAAEPDSQYDEVGVVPRRKGCSCFAAICAKMCGRTCPTQAADPGSATCSARGTGELILASRTAAAPRIPQGVSSSAAQAIANARDLGRYLEAVRLLDDCGSDEVWPEAAHLREVAEAVTSTARERAESAGPLPPGWQEREAPGLRLRFLYDPHSGDVRFIADLRLEFEALKVWSLFREFDLSPSFMPRTIKSEVLQTFSGNCALYRFLNKPVMRLMACTEALQERNYVDALEEHGAMFVVGLPPPLTELSYRSVALPPVPPKVKRITSEARDVFEPLSPTSTMMTVERKLKTPFRFVPTGVIGMLSTTLVKAQHSQLVDALSKWESSEQCERTRSGQRAPYYAQLRLRLDAAAERKAAA